VVLSAVPLFRASLDGTWLPYNSRSVLFTVCVGSCELKCAFTATSVVAERVFSRGRILLSHIRTVYLLKQLIRSCVSVIGVGMVWLRIRRNCSCKWCRMFLRMMELDWEVDLEDGWDAITLYNTVALLLSTWNSSFLSLMLSLILYAVLAWKIFIIVASICTIM